MTVFADTYYFLGLLNPHDAAHAACVRISARLSGGIVATRFVLMEVADAFAAPQERAKAWMLIDSLVEDPQVTIVPASDGLFDSGLTLYRNRPDKAWSLTDCISFVVMQEHGIIEALTGDHHFRQAGFTPLLEPQ